MHPLRSWERRNKRPCLVRFSVKTPFRSASQVLLTGEHVYPWMADDYAWLRPLKPAAEILAAKRDWGCVPFSALDYLSLPVIVGSKRYWGCMMA